MKKIIAMLLALAMALSLAACGQAPAAPEAPKAEAPKAEAPAAPEAEAPAAPEKITLTVWGPQADQGENGDGSRTRSRSCSRRSAVAHLSAWR